MPRATPALRRTLRRGVLLTIGVLYVISIPWYREGGSEPGRLLGLPDWVTVALLCYAAVAVLNAAAWALTEIPDPPADQGGAGSEDVTQ